MEELVDRSVQGRAERAELGTDVVGTDRDDEISERKSAEGEKLRSGSVEDRTSIGNGGDVVVQFGTRSQFQTKRNIVKDRDSQNSLDAS